MAINPVVEQHLRAARDVLVTQREALDHDIAQIDQMLGNAISTSGSATPRSASTGTAPARGPAPSMRDAIIDMLTSESRAFSTNEVAVELERKYEWSKASVRSLMSKLAKDGVIGNPRRGVYTAVPTSTSPSAGTEGEESDATSVRGGGPRDPDLLEDQQRTDSSDRSGAPIAAPE
ncbi:hypothetical protein GCM10009821_27530 [Aeromicrobium halocynthiae]|uniref:Uncharacterized protein n=1 Tax=Aeromicrobium halocynthiae TaxID=560557 RepID=A0ABN2W8A7_9ACTN